MGRIGGALPGRKVLTRTLHANLDDPSALIHPLDGVADTSTVEGFEAMPVPSEDRSRGLLRLRLPHPFPPGWEVLARSARR